MTVLVDALCYRLVFGSLACADERHAELGFATQQRLAERLFEVELIVPFNEADAERRRDEIGGLAFLDLHHITPLDDFGDMFGDGGVGADAVLVHEIDQVGFGEQFGRRGGAFLHLEPCWSKSLAPYERRKQIAFPLVVGKDLEVVALENDEA